VYPSEIVSVKPQIKLSKMPQLLMSLWPIGSSSSVTGKQELGGLLHFFRFKDRCRPSNSGHHHLGLLIIPAGYGNGKKVKNRSSYTQNYAPKMQPFFDLLPSFVCRWLRVISSNFLWPGSRNYQIIGLPFWLTD